MFENNPPAEIVEKTQQPILDNPGDYKLAIKKFTLDNVTRNLPIFHFFTTPNSSRQGIYHITVQVTGSNPGSTTVRVNIPQNHPQRFDLAEPFKDSLGNSFYHFYSIQSVVELFNEYIQQAFNATRTNNHSVTAEDYPFLDYNPLSNRIVAYAPTKGWGDINTLGSNEQWSLWFDQNTYNVFPDLPFYYGTDASGTKGYRIEFKSNRGRHIEQINPQLGTNSGSDRTFYKMVQEFESLGSYWSPVESIVLTSESLNIVPALQTAPIEYGNSRFSNLGQVSHDHAQRILTEFTIDSSNPRAVTQNLTFIANNYTFLSFHGEDHDALRELRFQFHYRDRWTADLIPLELPSQSSAYISILFQRKDIFER
jgi:hypothetical protein